MRNGARTDDGLCDDGISELRIASDDAIFIALVIYITWGFGGGREASHRF
jgi:hypothetical protein